MKKYVRSLEASLIRKFSELPLWQREMILGLQVLATCAVCGICAVGLWVASFSTSDYDVLSQWSANHLLLLIVLSVILICLARWSDQNLTFD